LTLVVYSTELGRRRRVKAAGLFAIAGIVLLGIELLLGFGTLAIPAWCFLVAIISVLVKGSAAGRLAVVFLLLSLGSFVYAILSFYGGELWLAASAALAILAVTMGISAYLTRDGPNTETTASAAQGSE
jgi:hypothetical protein